MADGELTLKLDDDTVRRLQAAADAAGRPWKPAETPQVTAT